eukprot:TRINITY_DN3506_c0_g5_i1.p1 TRINITY_DN3506_c0_g5~~TRINITY_DN3506_c0_g5_i1.p1  ORF type:complete len:355 (+),score=13.64 TRINITY_DN3506_c0_g5_i1:50-1114(+)
MGSCSSQDQAALEENAHGNRINRQLRQEHDQTYRRLWTLVLGQPNVGKSTICKQWKKFLKLAPSDEERRAYLPLLQQEVLQTIQKLIFQSEALAQEHDSLFLVNQNILHAKQQVLQLEKGARVEGQVKDWLKELWSDPGIQATYDWECKHQLNEHRSYMEHVDEVLQADYWPTEQDILDIPEPITATISEFSAQIFDTPITFVIGHKLTASSKILHCFERVYNLIYVVSLADYDQINPNNPQSNRLQDAIDEVDQLMQSQWFRHARYIVFLNKQDEFRRKLERGVELNVAFPEYKGDSCETAEKFIMEKFEERARQRQTSIYIYLTCAINSNHINYTFNAMNDLLPPPRARHFD